MKKYVPYIAAIAVFLAITIVYFHPILEGKRISQGDVINYKGMSKEVLDYRANTGKEALWTNSMFGGMPAFQISTRYSGDLLPYMDRIFLLGLPSITGLFFLYFLGFFILLLVLDVDPWISIAGAIAFALSSYFIIILGVGHNSKVHAIGYMAPVIAGILLTFRGMKNEVRSKTSSLSPHISYLTSLSSNQKYLLGGVMTALFLSLELHANHPQIAYYLFFIILFISAGEFINSIIEKTYMKFFKAVIVLVIAAFIGVLPNVASLWATDQYSKYTIRGKSELTFNKENKTTGLDKDYATDWSYGIGESFSLMIPNIKGGESGAIGDNEDAMKNVDPQYRETIASSGNQYWGDQPFTSGPVYVGAIISFLFVLGLFIVKGRLKWALFALTVFSIMLGWGRNFMGLTDFFLEHVPLYNKFRAVSIILVISEFSIPLLAILALNEVIKRSDWLIHQFKKQFFIALSLTGGLCLLFYLLPSSFFDFLSSEEVKGIAEQKAKSPNYAEQIDTVYANLQIARMSIFKADVLRSLLFIVISAAAIYFYALKKLAKSLFIVLMILFILFDLYIVDRRYLNEKNFVEQDEMSSPYKTSKADEYILKDNSLDYRVFNISKNPFTDAGTSYYHKSIGGYHGAKLKRYQELIEYRLGREMGLIKNVISGKPDALTLYNTFKNLTALNMLNTKYIIYNPEAEPLTNPYALGNAWFVDNYQMVENANAEITALNSLQPANTAVIDKRFKGMLTVNGSMLNSTFPKDSASGIKLLEYKPNYLIYKSISSGQQLAVFSEIYYDKGWNAFIDDKPAPYFRADYVLRAMILPAGEHKIEFKFEPKVYYIGNKISLAGSFILILSIVSIIFYEIKNQISKAKPLSTNTKTQNLKAEK